MYRVTFSQKELLMGRPFTKNSFHRETFGGNLWGAGVAVHEGTYDQTMSREGREELYKCIFQ